MRPVQVNIEESCRVAVESLKVYLDQLDASELILYGAGKNACYFQKLMAERGMHIAAIIDDHDHAEQTGIPVYDYDDYCALYDWSVPVFITLDPRSYSGAIKKIISRYARTCTAVFYLDGLLLLKPSLLTKNLLDRSSVDGCLYHLKQYHLAPKSVIDVGAAFGKWSLNCSRYFPESNYLLVEPLQEEFGNYLSGALDELPENFEKEVLYCAADAQNGERIFNVHENWTSSSLFNEVEGKCVDGTERVVACSRLDTIINRERFSPPYFIKLDTQGNELNALEGAEGILEDVQVVWMEVSFFPVFIHGPTMYDVIDGMKKRGFVLYDIVGLTYRLYDRALWQADAVFVPEKSELLKYSGYATKAQRLQQVAGFKSNYRQ